MGSGLAPPRLIDRCRGFWVDFTMNFGDEENIMVKLEQLKRGLRIRGLAPQQIVTLIAVEWSGANAVTVAYRREDGQVAETLLYRENEAELDIPQADRRWTFEADGRLLHLVSEAYRIDLAYLFDPLFAVHTSLIDPLPHQITAVYDEMLTRHPLRFLLADDPGAGKTVMAGLLIRELMVRGDVRRCLVCVPGSLTEQWQHELWTKFQLKFTILTRDLLETSPGGNPFVEHSHIIVRLDQVSRSQDMQAQLKQSDWDLVVCDEAHKMSATFFGGKLEETKRYRLGKLLGGLTRHFLLMTATPHNGKQEDFQLFLKLLDADRFEGRFRDDVHQIDAADMMRRMVKEGLLKFDGKPLFPERKAYTVNYELSPEEERLYELVTEYVRSEFDRADKLEYGGRRGTVGFALTILQRRLASSPEAIYQSLKRRRERLENRLKDAAKSHEPALPTAQPAYDEDYWEDFDDAPEAEVEKIEAELVDMATAAGTIEELQAEINTLYRLEAQALRVRRSGADRKWNELLRLLQDTPEIRDAAGRQRKLVIFTEHRDTLNYLTDKLNTLMGRPEAIVTIHGGIDRDKRRQVEESFRNDPDVLILTATDAAGEGINLQRAHLMVNYDLPWNPNRLEQRFGRIHRIGQKEVCHLWNLVASQTREGAVYQRLLEKLKTERDTLNGQVFDVLGKLFQETSLRKLLIDAVRYGDNPQIRARLEQAVDNATDQDHVRDILEEQSLIKTTLDLSQVIKIREDMERAAIRRLQPHYVKAFFEGAFEHLGGAMHEREAGRYAISYVPAKIRDQAAQWGLGAVAEKYRRICFEKDLIDHPTKPQADFVCPGHPLLDAIISLILQRNRKALRQGSILVDERDFGSEMQVLFYLEQAIQDARLRRGGQERTISREVHFVEINRAGEVRETGSAPYLDYRPATDAEKAQLAIHLKDDWLQGEQLEARAIAYAIEKLAPRHLEEIRQRRSQLIDKTEAAVRERLTKEINYWDGRAMQLRNDEQAGKVNARLNSQQAQKRADELDRRLLWRLAQLEQERQIKAARPIVAGGALIIPMSLLSGEQDSQQMANRRIIEQIAMQAVMEAEIALGNAPQDVSHRNCGYDIESRTPTDERLRFIEVKGRRADARTVTLTRHELYCALNSPQQFILALVEVEGNSPRPPRYLRGYAFDEPGPDEVSVNFNLRKLLAQSQPPG